MPWMTEEEKTRRDAIHRSPKARLMALLRMEDNHADTRPY